MAGVPAHPRIELRGTAPNFTLMLTDPSGEDFMESVVDYADEAEAQVALRLLEDSVRYALPAPTPVG